MTVSSGQKSTIDRSAIPPAPAAMRVAFRTLDRVAPGLAARWAQRLWFTVPPPGRASRRPGPPGGERFELDVDGYRIVGQAWGAGPAIYLMHGWGGWATQLGAFTEPLVGAGYRVVTFDAPSHGSSGPGRWGPRSSNTVEFTTALTAVVAAHGPAHAIVGHSLGCMAVAVAVRDGLAADRLVFLAPMSHPLNYVSFLGKVLGFGGRTKARLPAALERRIGQPISEFDVPAIASQVATPPLLVVHDQDDPETRHHDGQDIADTWPDSELVTTTGLGHRGILRDPGVVELVTTFVGVPAR